MAKILLVEDDNNLREIYQARLQAEGYNIVSARDGEEALVIAKQEQPDLVISDVMMPKISGFEMLDILRNTEGLTQVKVIMLTALGQAEDQTRADSLGADRYLVKSQVTLEDIVNAAKDLLEGPAPAEEAAVAAAAPPVLTDDNPVVDNPAPADDPIVSAVPVADDTPVIPLASAPPEIPEEIVDPSMPPTPESTALEVENEPNVPTQEAPLEESAAAPELPTPVAIEIPTAEEAPVIEESVQAPVVEEPVVEAPVDLTAESPVPTPSPEPTDAPEQVEAPAPVISIPVTADPLTEAEETASVEQQIESFVASQSGAPEPQVTPVTDEQVIIEPAATEPESQTTAEQEQALNDAVTNLSGGETPEPVIVEQPSTAPTAPVAPEAEPAVDISTRKKVIQPLSQEEAPKKDINELLAAEEAKQAEPQVTDANEPIAPTDKKNDFDPNSIAL